MRQEDYDRFDVPYDGLDSQERERKSREGLGVRTVAAHAMFEAIAGDLSEEFFGIGWWAPHPDKHRRILISDHLLLCAQGVEANIIEARLHLLELREARDKVATIMVNRVIAGPSGLPQIISHKRAGEELPSVMATLHLGGLLRAVGSALDCMAAVITGVTALEMNILFADFFRTLKSLQSIEPVGDASREAQADIGSIIGRAIDTVGPPGWLAWTIGYRNMLVHRGRHLQITRLLPDLSPIVSPAGNPVVRTRPVVVLPSDPGRSEVEVLVDAPKHNFMLTEDASVTVEGVYESTVQLVELTSRALLQLWARRKATPSFIFQPRKQWQRLPATEPCGFSGYAPKTVSMGRDAMHVNPLFGRRLMAAAISDGQRGEWDSND